MNVVPLTINQATNTVAITEDPASLNAFLDSGCAAAIWQRQTPSDIQAWLDGLDPAHLPRGRVIAPRQAVAETVRHICDTSDLPTGPQRDWLEADITALAARFAALLSPKFLRLRLDVITTNACRKFHIDAITARLVCTYRGTGTQYGISTDNADPSRVFTVQTGTPILLRGTLWPAEPPAGLLHRSPPIEGSGETRLVLVLDPVDGPEDDI